jgi:hypothetical protein
MNEEKMAERELANAVGRLEEKFPEVPHEHVDELVAEAQEGFEGAKVTDHIPNLVEHEVRDRLRAETGSEETAAG